MPTVIWCQRCRVGHEGRCPLSVRITRKQTDRWRGTAAERGYDADWRKVQRVVLANENGECRMCKAAGRLSVAVLVDHIVPIVDGGARLDCSNLQPLCRACHDVKTTLDVARRRGNKI